MSHWSLEEPQVACQDLHGASEPMSTADVVFGMQALEFLDFFVDLKFRRVGLNFSSNLLSSNSHCDN